MKKVIVLASAFLLLFGMPGIAGATPTTWTDTIDFNPDVLVPPTLSYWHDISDDGFSSSMTGGDDTIESFSLKVSIYDDDIGYTTRERIQVGWIIWPIWPDYDWVTVSHPDGSESARISFGLESHAYDFSAGSESYTGNFWGNLDLYHDGTLNVWISSTGGDFFVASSELVVNGDDGTAPVPEPATMLLFGTGLLGLAGARRKMKR